jgi:hypothetical protein
LQDRKEEEVIESSLPARTIRRTVLGGIAFVAALVCGVVAISSSPAVDARAASASGKPAGIRLLAGPVIYRLRTSSDPDASENETDFTYAVIARFSRVVVARVFDGEGSSAGNINIQGVGTTDATHEKFSPTRASGECVVAFIDKSETPASQLKKLAKLRIGRRVASTVQPLLTGIPDVTYGSTYHRRATLRSSTWNALANGNEAGERSIGCNH